VKAPDMISLSLLLTITIAFINPSDSLKPAISSHRSETINKNLLLQLVNDTRKKGCNCGDTYYPPAPPLTWNDVLEKAAFIHSKDMSKNKYFSHTSSDGTNAGTRIKTAGYNWLYYGENIAQGYYAEREVIAGWISSPGHCKNIMNKNYKEMGVANYSGYWTQTFGSK
jgi:uncharacterized protein YkwD